MERKENTEDTEGNREHREKRGNGNMVSAGLYFMHRE
jgi:hypothetical protein